MTTQTLPLALGDEISHGAVPISSASVFTRSTLLQVSKPGTIIITGVVTGGDLSALRLTRAAKAGGTHVPLVVDTDFNTLGELLLEVSAQDIHETEAGSAFQFVLDWKGGAELAIEAKSTGASLAIEATLGPASQPRPRVSLSTGNVSTEDLAASGDGTVGGNLDITGDLTAASFVTAGDLTVGGTATFSGDVALNGNTTVGNATTDTMTFTGRLILRTYASDPKHATPGSRPAGTVNEVGFFGNKLYVCTNAVTPTYELVTSV